MRLRKFKKEAKRNRKKILITLIVILATLTSILISRTYAFFQKENEVTFINAKVGKFVEKDIELAMKLDGKQVNTPPTKDNYTVTVTCDNATGTWDKDKWGALITNIKTNRVKCEVNFTTPKATLSTITATVEKTSVSLTYTAGGIGTSTTCVYGKTNSYGSSASSVTNSKCSISGLSMDTTYYYKVCAKNATGEVCKEGSIKTKPEWILAEHVNVGDYISMTPTATSYTIATSVTGYTSTQTINPSELNLWRVIRKNSDGTIEMVSDKVSSTTVTFYGKAGYLNFVGGLNTIAAQYTDGKHVHSTRHIGYSNQTETITDTSMISKTSPPWTKDTNTGWTATSSGFTEAQEAQGAGDVGYTTDYNLVNAVYGNMIANNPSGTATAYWLASRLFDYSSSTIWFFRGRYVDTSGGLANYILYRYSSGFDANYYSRAVRPIVTLKSTSEIESGSGTSSSPYVLD